MTWETVQIDSIEEYMNNFLVWLEDNYELYPEGYYIGKINKRLNTRDEVLNHFFTLTNHKT